MSHRTDPVFQTVDWLLGQRGGTDGPDKALSALWSKQGRNWAGGRVVLAEAGPIRYLPYEWAGVEVRGEYASAGGTAASTPLMTMLHVHADPSRAAREFEAGLARVVVAAGDPMPVSLLRDRIVVWAAVGEPDPGALSDLVDEASWRDCDAQLATAIADWRGCAPPVLVRWSPLERAVFIRDRPDGGGRYRVELDTNGHRAAETALAMSEMANAVAASGTNLELPRMIRYCPEAHALVTTELEGTSMVDLLPRLRPGGFAAVGAAIAELHRLPTIPLEGWSINVARSDLRERMLRISRAVPRLADRVAAVGELLDKGAEQLPPVMPRPIHGNLTADRVLCRTNPESGARRVAVAGRRARRSGDPHHDLGRLVAHLLLVDAVARIGERRLADRLRALLEGYQGGVGA
ncbi:MAG: hypothetical protein HKM95_13130, partial [Inquilinus sp.]|nr:hypothetical protein [Inquilinus sp.]